MRSKFIALDGIRGAAALFVLYHHAEHAFGFHLGRSYLAVDVFFLLSGFVIAHSYEQRLRTGQLSPGWFMLIRLIRLYPMYLISLLLTLAIHRASNPWDVLRGLLMWPRLGDQEMFPLNAVYWSLFFEIFINALYAFTRARISDRVLLCISGSSAVLLLFFARKFGGLNLGFDGTPIQVTGGFLRSLFGIALGLLLYRRRHTLFARLSSIRPWQPIALISLALASPEIGRFNYVADWILVVGLFPPMIVVAALAGSVRAAGLQTLLGTASYPLYLLHTPVAWWALQRFPEFLIEQAPVSGVLLTFGIVVLALGLEKVLDLPVRRWLTRCFVTIAPMPPAGAGTTGRRVR